VIKIFAVGHRKIIDFLALAKNGPRVPEKSLRLFWDLGKQLSFLQKSNAFLPQFNPKSFAFLSMNPLPKGSQKVERIAKLLGNGL